MLLRMQFVIFLWLSLYTLPLFSRLKWFCSLSVVLSRHNGKCSRREARTGACRLMSSKSWTTSSRIFFMKTACTLLTMLCDVATTVGKENMVLASILFLQLYVLSGFLSESTQHTQHYDVSSNYSPKVAKILKGCKPG